MNHVAWTPFRKIAPLGALLLGLGGCKVSVDVEPLTRFEGTKASKSVEYAAGQSISVSSVNGDVTILVDAAADTVSADFEPFTMKEDDKGAEAKKEMACGEGKCGEGKCGGSKTEGDGKASPVDATKAGDEKADAKAGDAKPAPEKS